MKPTYYTYRAVFKDGAGETQVIYRTYAERKPEDEKLFKDNFKNVLRTSYKLGSDVKIDITRTKDKESEYFWEY